MVTQNIFLSLVVKYNLRILKFEIKYCAPSIRQHLLYPSNTAGYIQFILTYNTIQY